MSSTEVRLAQYGMGMNDAEIVQWLVDIGDTVAVDQPIVVVDAAKVTAEVTASVAGTIAERRFAVGDVADVGEVLAVIDHQD